MLPWVLCGVLSLLAAALAIKQALLHRDIKEIVREMEEHLSEETNTPILLSTGDRQVRRLAAQLNVQLRALRQARLQYQSGDQELKEAVTNISHDLRTPLTAICGYLELMEREDKSETVAGYLALMKNRAQALTQLTEELFRYSVILSTADSLRIEAVNLNGALEESLAAFFAALTARGIAPEVCMPEQTTICYADKKALSRVLSNVIGNALKYSDGDLRVALGNDGQVVFSNRANKLDEVQVGKLFNRFFTVENAQGATGLGLSIARTLMEKMGGSIEAQYAQGRLSISLRFQSASR